MDNFHNFHNELQALNVGDFNTSQAVNFDPNGFNTNQVAQLDVVGRGGSCFRCSSCSSCFSCFSCFFTCFNCFNCFRCSNCFRCGGR